MSLEVEAEDARIRGVDEPQPHPLAATHCKRIRHAAVDRNGIADPAAVAHVMAVAEIIADLGGLCQSPVIDDPGYIAVHARRFGLFDDQRTVESAPEVRCGTPSIAFGSRNPCQWTVVSSARAFSTVMRRRSPCRTRISGPGTAPL